VNFSARIYKPGKNRKLYLNFLKNKCQKQCMCKLMLSWDELKQVVFNNPENTNQKHNEMIPYTYFKVYLR
jgi:hypothetical protein